MLRPQAVRILTWLAGVRRLRLRSLLPGLPPLVLVVFFVVTGFRGIDFGSHWDEVDWQIRPVRDMVASGILMPRATIYPSMSKWLVLMPAVPAAVRAGLKPDGGVLAMQPAAVARIDEPGYLLTVRRLFVVVSALAIIWIYGAGLALRRKWWEATIAAAALGLSWEYGYHARWVATDCILVQFSALTIFMLALFHRTGQRQWLLAAAIAAGLGTGSKYPGVFLLVPVICLGLSALPRRTVGSVIARVAALCAIAFVAYLVTTPSTVFDPFKFVEAYHWISHQYLRGHAGHAVASSWQHWRVALAYFALAFFSPFRVAAVVLAACSVVGAVVWVRRERWMGITLVCFPVAFLCFFCFRFLDAVVRNYLVIAPFLALLAARGVGALVDWVPSRFSRPAVIGVIAAFAITFGGQAVWLARAAESIRHVDGQQDVRQALAYVAAHPQTRFRLSTKVRESAVAQGMAVPSNVTDTSDARSAVFFAIAEGPGTWDWKTNDPWQVQAVFGPREMNFDWYSGWTGHDRVVVMTIDKAKATGVPMVR